MTRTRGMAGVARSVVIAAGALATTLCSAVPAAADVGPPPASTPTERVTAVVHPALVRVTGTFTRVHDRKGAYANNGKPYAYRFTCSGFGVHPDGYLATVAHCVDPNDLTVRETFIRAAAEESAANRPDIPLEKWLEFGRSAWSIEGPAAGSPVVSEIRVSGVVGAPPEGMPARVVDARPAGQGGVALLKVDTTDLPALELATGTAMAVGTPLLATGYPEESMGDFIEPGASPSVHEGAVIGTRTDGGQPVYEINAGLEEGMSGGPAVDHSGRVLGIISARGSATKPLDIAIPIGPFSDLLGRNGARAELGPRDLAYRDALDADHSGEYTDAIEAIEAIDRLQQEGPTHPRIGELRNDAEASRDQHGDASENQLTQTLIWVGVAMGTVLIAIGVVLVIRRRHRSRVPIMGTSPPSLPGAYAGSPWQGLPGEPLPASAPHQWPAADVPNHQCPPAAAIDGNADIGETEAAGANRGSERGSG